MFRIEGITTSAAASHGTAPAVTFDLFTALVAGAALVLAWLVYRWTAPSPEASVQASRGERLAYAIGSAASVIVVGAFLIGGVRGSSTPVQAPVSCLLTADQRLHRSFGTFT
ncbi:hypothetical protein [Streptomyces parvus]|uniref:hypothetical protein n=1 Tax=Streptomyces parvus TaxID=66428 RepID=UPI0035DAACED